MFHHEVCRVWGTYFIKWWAILEGYEKIVLQFSHEAREFFPELLDTWEAPKADKKLKTSKASNEFRGE